jgi:hypothetical protein
VTAAALASYSSLSDADFAAEMEKLITAAIATSFPDSPRPASARDAAPTAAPASDAADAEAAASLS